MRPLPQKVIEGLGTTSEKIRALHAAGFERTEIRDFLKIRYQHVRNVLVSSSGASSAVSKASTKPMPTPKRETVAWGMNKLLENGFSLLGEWQSTSEAAFKLSSPAPKKAGVYAFAVDEIVTYIGLTQTGISTRLGHYVYGHVQQRTSARVKALILEALSAGSKVEVLVAFPPSLVWNDLPVDGAAGLEAGLLRAACPAWNKQGILPHAASE